MQGGRKPMRRRDTMSSAASCATDERVRSLNHARACANTDSAMGDSSLPAYVVDTSRWPLVTSHATTAVHDIHALDATYAALEAVIARKQLCVTLFDMRGGASDSQRRKRFVEWFSNHQAAIKQWNVAHAVVVGTAIERGFVTAASWLMPPVVPFRVFTDPREAEAWLIDQYEKRTGTRIPPAPIVATK